MRPIRKILHPTDFSTAAEPAVDLAIELARTYDAELTIMNVFSTQLYVAPLGGTYPLPPDFVHKIQVEVEQALARLRERAVQAGVNVQTLSVQGNATDEILATAERLGIDHIVMGTHGRTGLNHLLLGSVAERVLRRATCPVTTVRQAKK
jgi:nucleotide-binding universal stress UspA family protein